MTFTATAPSGENARPFKKGTLDAEYVNLTAASGDTSGTITARSIARLAHVLLPSGFVQTAAPVYSGNTATLAFTVPAETAASLVMEDLTFTAVAGQGAAANSITIYKTSTVLAGSEVVSVSGNEITIEMESGASTATEIRTAFLASAEAVALVTCTISGAGANTQTSAAATPLAGGVTGGAATALCLGTP
jgi:hypothetical protein